MGEKKCVRDKGRKEEGGKDSWRFELRTDDEEGFLEAGLRFEEGWWKRLGSKIILPLN